MKNKSILATLLSLALAINCVTQAFAEEVDDPVKMDTPVNVTAEAMEFSVMVPTSLPVNVAADGTISVADNAAIENNSYGPVKITNVVVTPATGWALMDFDTDVSTIPMNSKKIGLKLQNNKVNTDGTVSLQGFGTINGGIGLELSYDAIVGGFSTDTNVSAASVTITIGWDEATITGYDVKPPKVDASDLNPEDYGVDYIVTVGSQFYMTGTATYALEGEENPFDGITWTSSDESIATVDTDGLVTVLAAGYFDISGEIPGLDEPVTVKYGVPKEGTSEIPVPIIAHLTFEEESSQDFTFQMSQKNWDGTLEYSTDGSTWIEYNNASTIVNSVDGKLYLRGSNNSTFGVSSAGSTIKLLPETRKIKCIGNIENLLDYNKVLNQQHPKMGPNCFRNLFFQCKALTQAPELPAIELSEACYTCMFMQCTQLTQAPELPATTLSNMCYWAMLQQTAITQAPELPATTLANECYMWMFRSTQIEQAPALPATTLAEKCYCSMFSNCTKLTKAPVLPATTLAKSCYETMFDYCTSLKEAPALPATTLAEACYQWMFSQCTSLIKLPALKPAPLIKNCYKGMFNNCTSIKVSSTETGEYTIPYTISNTGSSVAAADVAGDMFKGTSGTYTGTAYFRTYYISNTNNIV